MRFWKQQLKQGEQKTHFKIKVLQHKTRETRHECNTKPHPNFSFQKCHSSISSRSSFVKIMLIFKNKTKKKKKLLYSNQIHVAQPTSRRRKNKSRKGYHREDPHDYMLIHIIHILYILRLFQLFIISEKKTSPVWINNLWYLSKILNKKLIILLSKNV